MLVKSGAKRPLASLVLAAGPAEQLPDDYDTPMPPLAALSICRSRLSAPETFGSREASCYSIVFPFESGRPQSSIAPPCAPNSRAGDREVRRTRTPKAVPPAMSRVTIKKNSQKISRTEEERESGTGTRRTGNKAYRSSISRLLFAARFARIFVTPCVDQAASSSAGQAEAVGHTEELSPGSF